MKAIWDFDYDLWADDDEDYRFLRPMCPRCHEPIGKIGEKGENKYRCYNCYELIEVEDEEMLKWLEDREETKTEMWDCFVMDIGGGRTIGCDGKNCVEVHFYKDPRTAEWRVGGGECKKCGKRFIV